MDVTIETSLSLPKTLFDQAERLAQKLTISQTALFESAIENFIQEHQNSTSPDEINHIQPTANEPSPSSSQDAQIAMQSSRTNRKINQGDIYWVALENPDESDPPIPHPYIIVQDNVFNHSRIHTVVACALTSNLRRTSDTPGNLLLEIGEANLPKQSVVEVSKVSTIKKAELGEYIGSLSEQRIHQILAGMRFLQMSYFDRE